ncbi:MAG: RecQ family ATP-dependent DNA helicase [Thermomicrobiales bacterium]|nr:MAG: RecQ family ATP-dependent DNA helicase [Thermomicrobiales bacterium]
MFAIVRMKVHGVSEGSGLLERIDDRMWRALPLELRWKIIPWAIELGELDRAGDLIEAMERERGESAKLIEFRLRLASLGDDEAERGRLLELRAERYPSATSTVQLARFLLEQGEIDRAAELYQAVRQTSADQLQVKQLGDAIDRALGNSNEVRHRLQCELSADPDGFWPNLLMASWLLDHDRADAARPLLHKIIVEAIEQGFEARLLRLTELLDRAGEANLASDLRSRYERARDARHAELHAKIETALEAVGTSAAGWELDASVLDTLADPSSEDGIAAEAAHGPLDPRVFDVLQRDFGHTTLRDGQRQVIERVLAGADTLGIMPTGAGKSLTFQLPAMLLPGVTIVISPLIALMKDQLESLPPRVRGRSTVINSTLSLDETQRRLDGIRTGEIKLVYIAPERFRDHRFLRALQRVPISLAVIDEAHCINLWGSDFRPDYLFIPKALAELGDPPVLALTATATPTMANQIGAGLGRDLGMVRVSLYRSNLFYSVETVRNREEKVTRLVEICKKLQGAGIVYVGSRKDAESLAATLCDRGVQAAPYHAGLDTGIRARNQERFMSGQTRVVCATVAFGMGIDKSDVRFIVHFSAPASLEAYAQESGRAGRDGRGARCILLSTANDGTRLKQFARREEIKIDSLRGVYKEIKRAAEGEWTVVDPRRIELALNDPDSDDQIDSRVALGIIEQAGLITRHPDAPVSYALSRFMGQSNQEDDRVSVPERYRAWKQALELPTTIGTAAACSALGISPFELDRYLTEDATLTVRGGMRGIAVRLLPPPHNIADRMTRLLDKSRADSERRIDLMMRYIQDREGYCRHVMLAAHLGERLAPCGTACDVCTGKVKPNTARAPREQSSRPTLADAEVLLEAIGSLPFTMGKPGLTRLLIGSEESKVRSDRSEHFGALKRLTPHAIGTLVDELIEHDYLGYFQKDEYRLIEMTSKGRNARSVELPGSRIERRAKLSAMPDAFDPYSDEGKRYSRLAEWRKRQGQTEGKALFVIASNSQLREIALAVPASLPELANVHGFGASRAERYGEEILRILAS